MLEIFNEDCIPGAKEHFEDNSVDLIVCDPPFGIGGVDLDVMYHRKKESLIHGYKEQSLNEKEYQAWTFDWVSQAKRILKPNGAMYVFSSWSKYDLLRNVVSDLKLYIINEIIWKYNFGVYTKNKYVTSHYPILYLKKDKKEKHTFNRECRYKDADKDDRGSVQYRDREDVWTINREYHPGEKKNVNKLPDEIVRKMIQYSSNPGDKVCDFFLGNFTTVKVAKELGRIPSGFEINKESFEYFKDKY
jgi:site-specific DNA-methyltransferase (adenine-specific)